MTEEARHTFYIAKEVRKPFIQSKIQNDSFQLQLTLLFAAVVK